MHSVLKIRLFILIIILALTAAWFLNFYAKISPTGTGVGAADGKLNVPEGVILKDGKFVKDELTEEQLE